MSAVTLDETMTFWTVSGKTGTGGKLFNDGVAVPAKHATRQELITTPEGKTVTSKRVYYSETALDVGGYVALGDFSGTSKPDKTADQIIMQNSVPSMTSDSKIWV